MNGLHTQFGYKSILFSCYKMEHFCYELKWFLVVVFGNFVSHSTIPNGEDNSKLLKPGTALSLSEIFLGSGSSIELNTVCGLKSRENAEKSFRRLSFERLKLQKNNIYIWKPLNSGFWSYVQLCGGNNHSFYLMLVRPQNATHKGANNSRVQGFYSKIIYEALGYY